jgi:hypothetical protein
VFLGYKINPKKNNPYAPSAISARIATTDSNRYIELALSGEQGNKLQAIFFASSRGGGGGEHNALTYWDDHTKKSNVNRRTRYIYTGNLLQAFDRAQSGKLISYTCKNGETKKGILMPEHWSPSERGQNTARSVPLKFCRKAISGMSRGALVNTDADVSFMLQYDGNIRIITKSLSMDKFGWLVKNKELLPFITDWGGFQKTGSSWVGSINPQDLQRVIEIIYAEKGCNALLSVSQVELIQDDIVRTEVKKKERIELPPEPKNTRAAVPNMKSAMPNNVHVVRPETDFPAKSNGKERRLRVAKTKSKVKLKMLNLIKL